MEEAAHNFIALSPDSQHSMDDINPPSPKHRKHSSNAKSQAVNEAVSSLKQQQQCLPACYTSAVADLLSKPPAVPVTQQEDLIHAIGGLLSDAYRDVSSIQTQLAVDAVICHMSRD